MHGPQLPVLWRARRSSYNKLLHGFADRSSGCHGAGAFSLMFFGLRFSSYSLSAMCCLACCFSLTTFGRLLSAIFVTDTNRSSPSITASLSFLQCLVPRYQGPGCHAKGPVGPPVVCGVLLHPKGVPGDQVIVDLENVANHQNPRPNVYSAVVASSFTP